MKLTIEIPDTIKKDEAILKKDLIKFIDERLDYFQEVLKEQPKRYDDTFYDKVFGSITSLRLLKSWIEDYEL